MTITKTADLRRILDRVVAETPVRDIHTHLYDPAFGDLLLWGVDELLTYHYLVAEFFRVSSMPYADFWALSKPQRADAIWKSLFLDHSPLSEATRGVLTVFQALGIDVQKRELRSVRKWYAEQKPWKFIDLVFKTANLREVVMTNDPFDDAERPVWVNGYQQDPRFRPALRVDPVLLGWDKAWLRLKEWGYQVAAAPDSATLRSIAISRSGPGGSSSWSRTIRTAACGSRRSWPDPCGSPAAGCCRRGACPRRRGRRRSSRPCACCRRGIP